MGTDRDRLGNSDDAGNYIAYVARDIVKTASRLFVVPVRNHGFDAVDICAETSQFHLLALAGLNCQRVRIDPLVSGDLGRLGGIGEDVKHCWLVDNWQEGHTGHDLLEDGSDFGLDLFLGLGRNCISGDGPIMSGDPKQRYNVLT
jgi:hypothetical protein